MSVDRGVGKHGFVTQFDLLTAEQRQAAERSRELLRQQVIAATEMGYDYVAGLEIEFYVVRRDSDRIELNESGWPPPPPRVSVLEQGYQYLSEVRLAGINDLVERLRDTYLDLGL